MANEHNGAVPRDHWVEQWEREAIIAYHGKNPLEGYRRLTFMMLDEDVVCVSPSTTYRVLKAAGLLDRWNRQPSKKGAGFVQPLKPHEHWHIDIGVPQISGVRDGGRSPEIALQEEISNHRKRLGPKAPVVSVTEKVQEMHQVRTKKMNTSEPSFTCRKCQDGIKTREVMLPEDELGECLLIGQAVPGIEAASAWFGLSR